MYIMKRKPITPRIRTNISISKDMYDKIKHYDFALSPFVEIRLREYFALIEKPGNQYQHTIFTQEAHFNAMTKQTKMVKNLSLTEGMRIPGFEPE
jgi:hypothetical protein